MQRFVFPLDRIRAWNGARLQAEETALEGVLDEERKAEAAYTAVCAQRTEFEQVTLRRRLIDSSELARIAQFRQFVAAEGRRLVAVGAAFSKRIAEARARIIEIKRKNELIDRLRVRQQKAWTAEETRELQAAADEVFLQRIVARRN
jgi:flagellar biosynthesis chaperone FliJ